MTNLDSVLKSRDITLPTKVHIVKAMVFPVVMYECNSWTIKETECRRIDAFELWWWWRLLRVPWTARRSNQSILKEISPEYSLEGLMLKWNSNNLATWCEELTHLKRPWCWERLKAGEGDNRGWDGWMASPTQWHEFEQTLGDGEWQGSLMCYSPRGHRVGHNWATEQQQIKKQILFVLALLIKSWWQAGLFKALKVRYIKLFTVILYIQSFPAWIFCHGLIKSVVFLLLLLLDFRLSYRSSLVNGRLGKK